MAVFEYPKCLLGSNLPLIISSNLTGHDQSWSRSQAFLTGPRNMTSQADQANPGFNICNCNFLGSDDFTLCILQFHPDMVGNKSSVEEMVAVNVAFSILSKPLERRDYDRRLGFNRYTTTHTENG